MLADRFRVLVLSSSSQPLRRFRHWRTPVPHTREFRFFYPKAMAPGIIRAVAERLDTNPQVA